MIQKEGQYKGYPLRTFGNDFPGRFQRPLPGIYLHRQINTLKYLYETQNSTYSDARRRDLHVLCAGRSASAVRWSSSSNGRVALSNVQVKIESLGLTAMTDKDGNFIFENLPKGDYTVSFSNPEFEPLDLMVRVGDKHVQDLKSVIIVPSGQSAVLDDAVFAEFDSDSSSSDTQALPSSLSSSKDLFNNIASYRFSEMRFNVRGYDSQYSDIYLNGIRFNDAMTGYGPWSLWSGLNDATRNQENYTGLEASDFGIGGIGGMTKRQRPRSQMRKGFRVSVSNGNQMYRFRAMVSYGSGQLDNGWSYAFSVGTRQGGNGYVDGVYYNSYSYFASAEKLFGQNHRLALTLLASPSERGAQQASTDEAYALFGNNYYNPNVGYQAGKLRNSRVRNTHEPIVMLNYTWDMSENTRLNAATSLRFGKNGYSALTWNAGADPRGDYYRYMPLSDKTQIVPGITTDRDDLFLRDGCHHGGRRVGRYARFRQILPQEPEYRYRPRTVQTDG